MLDPNGTAANHVMFVANSADAGAMSMRALTQMDGWLAAIRADTGGGGADAKTIRSRPAGLSDACWTSATTRIDETFGWGLGGTCEGLYPTWADTRLAAGQGLANDVLKCRLRRIDFDSYGVAFSAEQKARLLAAFPTGVCDYTKKGLEQQRAKGPLARLRPLVALSERRANGRPVSPFVGMRALAVALLCLTASEYRSASYRRLAVRAIGPE